MASRRAGAQLLGYPIELPDEVPGFRLKPPEVPGFRLNPDGSLRDGIVDSSDIFDGIATSVHSFSPHGGAVVSPTAPLDVGWRSGMLPFPVGSPGLAFSAPALQPGWARSVRVSQPPVSTSSDSEGPILAVRDTWSADDGPGVPLGETTDPNIVRVGDKEPVVADDDVQVARQSPPRIQKNDGESRQAPPPGRGYVEGRQAAIERGMTPLQVRISREQAFRELARQPLTTDQTRSALPDDWESTKPADLVDEIRRAAERHGVPLQMFARQLYREGKFNEKDKLKRPLLMDSNRGNWAIGYAQMTKDTFQTLKNLARLRGDTDRLRELNSYSLGDRAQSFDIAAEQLAYLYRLSGGSWPKALAGYNYGQEFMKWFDGKPVTISQDKWKEIAAYLAYALTGAAEDPYTGDSYVFQPPNAHRVRDRIYRPAVPSDTKLNP